jgi:hypothetical protein
MHDVVLKSGWDTFLYAAPLLGALFIGFFRLDELISASRQKIDTRPKLTGSDRHGEPLLSDPDGRLWDPGAHRHNRVKPH